MKKAYSAPDIVFESFSLCVSIASCDVIEKGATKGSCGYKWDAETKLFTTTLEGCTDLIEDGSGDWNGICYHVPTSDKDVFGS